MYLHYCYKFLQWPNNSQTVYILMKQTCLETNLTNYLHIH